MIKATRLDVTSFS